MTDYPHWIDGAERAPSGGQWIEAVDPFKGDVWARVARGNAADADAAVQAASRAICGLQGAEGRHRLVQDLPHLQRHPALRRHEAVWGGS